MYKNKIALAGVGAAVLAVGSFVGEEFLFPEHSHTAGTYVFLGLFLVGYALFSGFEKPVFHILASLSSLFAALFLSVLIPLERHLIALLHDSLQYIRDPGTVFVPHPGYSLLGIAGCVLSWVAVLFSVAATVVAFRKKKAQKQSMMQENGGYAQ